MRYTINGFQQNKLVEFGLDNNDSLILRWFVDFYHSGKMSIVNNDGKNYLWVSYKSVIEDLPIMGINSKEVIARRFKKMVECGLMEHFTKKEGGTFSCYRLNEKMYSELITPDMSTQKSEQYDSKVGTPYDSKVGTKDSSIKINSSTKDNDKIKKSDDFFVEPENQETLHTPKKPDELDKFIDFWNITMNQNIIIQKKDRGPLYGIIKSQTLKRLKNATLQAKKANDNPKGVKYTFGSIVYKASNIAALSAQFEADDPHKDLPESIKKNMIKDW